jgi:hypothetical protein
MVVEEWVPEVINEMDSLVWGMPAQNRSLSEVLGLQVFNDSHCDAQ